MPADPRAIAKAQEYLSLAAVVGDRFHLRNASEHLSVARDGDAYDFEATAVAMEKLRNIAPTYDEFRAAALVVVEMRFILDGSRFAEESDMVNLRLEPMADYDLVARFVEAMPRFKGWTVAYGGKVVRGSLGSRDIVFE